MINFLKGLSLTIGQWLLVTMATALGILIFLLRRQGTALHRAQVELLGARLDREQDKYDATVDTAYRAWETAEAAYLEAKKRRQQP